MKMNARLLRVTLIVSVGLSLIILYLYNRKTPSEANYPFNDMYYSIPGLDTKDKGHQGASDLVLPKVPYSWYTENCFLSSNSKQDGRSIDDVYNKLQDLRTSSIKACKEVPYLFDLMFRFEENIAQLTLPQPFQKQVLKWLDNNPKLFNEISHQKVYKITNKWTFEESVYNPLRSKRPKAKTDINPVDYIENLTLSTSASCDFCSYRDHTAADVFGRIDNEFSASASNTFKLAKFHGLFFPKSHHPLKLTYEVLEDIFLYTSQQWFQKAYEWDSKQIYPSLLWDSLPHAGASQVHPHIHGLLGENQYAGLVESMHHVAEKYYSVHKRSYWTDFVLVHWVLGLAIQNAQAALIVPLNSRKDHEYMIISPSVNEDAVKLLYRVTENYKNNLNVYCWSGGGSYPVMNNSRSGLPMIFRIGSRGVCTSVSSDVSSLELYTVNNINTDLEKTFTSVLNSTDF